MTTGSGRHSSRRRSLPGLAGFLPALRARGWTVSGLKGGGFAASHSRLGLEVKASNDVVLYRTCTTVELEARLAVGATVLRVEGAR